jgi:hypothetical protein
VIEKVTGKTYEEAVKELVLDPLGMANSFFFTYEIMTRRFMVGHANNEDKVEVYPQWLLLPRSVNPAGALVSTAGDQIKFARFHMGDGKVDEKQVLKRETLDIMKAPTYAIGGGVLGDHVGISWLMRDYQDGVRTVGHGGATLGQHSTLQLVPVRDFAITILTNAVRGEELHGEILKWALENYLGVKQDDPAPLDLSNEQLAEFAGEYRIGEHALLKVSVEDGKLVGKEELNELGRERMKMMTGDENPPEEPPAVLQVLAGDLLSFSDGQYKGMKHSAVRGEGGKVTGINFGGRLILKI